VGAGPEARRPFSKGGNMANKLYMLVNGGHMQMGNGIKFLGGTFETECPTQQRQIEQNKHFKSGRIMILEEDFRPEAAASMPPTPTPPPQGPKVSVGTRSSVDTVDSVEDDAPEMPPIPSKTKITKMKKADRIRTAKIWSKVNPKFKRLMKSDLTSEAIAAGLIELFNEMNEE